MLVSAWLNTSKDPITSNQQRLASFWGRIAKYFASYPNAVGRPKREAGHCKQRWGRINDLVCKFVGCFEAASREKSIGQNEDDVMKLAHEIYFNDHGHRFSLEHAWLVLRYDQKWCASTSIKANGVKRGRASVEAAIDVDEPMPRPPGIKAVKGKSKKAPRPNRMWRKMEKDFALKEKEFALKKEHIKHVILENLIAKKDSLTESEKALKEKLIEEMMSIRDTQQLSSVREASLVRDTQQLSSVREVSHVI
ncbi:PREDICTED: glutathione S-transferase T3-like [Camelina sativa]|uniref:Glutathione S-transferase T3-like n=1 Tax=Camelina sativa TaxID=90675 RepID=A0ABM0WB37_CAMSA|nr:PREDICTED: glutathione S-transferase T3-like [Camelina sativa]